MCVTIRISCVQWLQVKEHQYIVSVGGMVVKHHLQKRICLALYISGCPPLLGDLVNTGLTRKKSKVLTTTPETPESKRRAYEPTVTANSISASYPEASCFQNCLDEPSAASPFMSDRIPYILVSVQDTHVLPINNTQYTTEIFPSTPCTSFTPHY